MIWPPNLPEPVLACIGQTGIGQDQPRGMNGWISASHLPTVDEPIREGHDWAAHAILAGEDRRRGGMRPSENLHQRLAHAPASE